MAQGEDFRLQPNSRTERITKSGEQENQDPEHHQSLLPHCAKCNQFSKNEFFGTHKLGRLSMMELLAKEPFLREGGRAAVPGGQCRGVVELKSR
jgi:hypothetical protein